MLAQFEEKFRENQKEYLNEFFQLLRFQSISSEEEYLTETLACADWIRNFLEKIGFSVEVWETSGYPVIFAHHLKAGERKPTLLIYNHYDVQPVDPLELWNSPPFEPTEVNGSIYARGAQDNKGQLFYVLLALKTLLAETGELPINVKLCIEGEEEKGSAGLASILGDKQKELRADYLAVVDVGIPSPRIPAVTLGVRGLIALELEVSESKVDLHSGSHGGIVYNPIHALVELLAKARNDKGKIVIPGFYDNVQEFSPEEKEQLHLEFDHEEYMKLTGIPPSGGEQEFTPLERAWLRPTLEINGIIGGYTGKGIKTVIPSRASAKITCRLVPNQNPQKIGEALAQFFTAHAPSGVKVSVHIHPGGGEAVRANPSSKVVQAFTQAYSEVFQKPCGCIFEGGSIPIVTELSKASKSEVVLIGLGLGSDLIHAPNEHFSIERIKQGFLIISRGLTLLGETHEIMK